MNMISYARQYSRFEKKTYWMLPLVVQPEPVAELVLAVPV